MLSNEKMQKELKLLSKKLEGAFREVCPIRKRGMIELYKRDIINQVNSVRSKAELVLEESIYLTTLQKAWQELSFATKDNIDISIDKAKTELSIGIYELRDLPLEKSR